MITSALISQCRREYDDNPKSIRVSRQSNGSVNLFNTGHFPVLENSYVVYVSGVVKSETTDYTINRDTGDVQLVVTPANGVEVAVQFKYMEWRDQEWLDAINDGIDSLNGRGFFKQIARVQAPFSFSAGIQKYSGPSACVDIYELLVPAGPGVSGNLVKPRVNWSYQQDSNNVIIGNKPSVSQRAYISYLRALQPSSATSSTVDANDQWLEMIKKSAGSSFWRSLAGKIAKQGNATIDEGHFSFTNLRTMANDLSKDFENLTIRKKPTRPAKDLQYNDPNGGVA